MTRRIRITIAALALLALGAIGGGVAHAAFVFLTVAPGDYGYLVCNAPGNQALGVQIAAYENGEPVAYYIECKDIP